MYEYKMVQIPRDLSAKVGEGDNLAANMLQRIVDQNAIDGWEFYRIDNLTILEKPGCLGSLMGQKEIFSSVGVVSFRRVKPKA